MKSLIPCLLAVMSVSGMARSGPVVVFDAPVNADETVAAKFDFDSKLGRAWVDVEEFDYRYEGTVDRVMKRVDGLYYDAATKQVVYRQGTNPVVCAEEASFLGISSLHTIGQCPLVVPFEDRSVDDGFHPDKQTFVKVILNPGM